MLVKTAGTVRYCYNWGLAKWNELYQAGKPCNTCELSRLWTKERPEWAKETYRGSQTRAFMNLGSAFARFFRKQDKHPVFHKKGYRDSFCVDNAHCVLKSDKRIRLPNIGVVRMAEKLRFDGKILRFTVSRTADRWYVGITMEVADVPVVENNSTIGVDVGAKHWAVASDGTVFDKPASLSRLDKRLRHVCRNFSRKQKGSKNRDKARVRLTRVYQKIRNVKLDAMHKFTTGLTKSHSIVCCENLSVRGMGRSVKSIRSAVKHSCMGELRLLLSYKAQHYVEIDQFYPSSKRCSKCGHVKTELSLSERIYRCEACGNVLDRDLNAAINIRDEGLRVYTEGHSGSACGERGSSARVPSQNGASR